MERQDTERETPGVRRVAALLGPVALVVLGIAIAGSLLHAGRTSEARSAQRATFLTTGELPPAPRGRVPSGIDRRPLDPDALPPPIVPDLDRTLEHVRPRVDGIPHSSQRKPPLPSSSQGRDAPPRR